MKENSTRILTWLYPEKGNTRWVSTQELRFFVPDVTPTGLQSLLFFLQSKKRIVVEKISGVQQVSITSYGMKALEQAVPAFSPHRRNWEGEWWAVVFLEALPQDKNFRFLRRVLLAEHALPLTRGVFLFPGYLPEKVSYELRQVYEGAVVVAPLKKWYLGDDKEIIGSLLQMGDLANAYSSISREIDGLLEKEYIKKGFIYQNKNNIFSLFDRLFSSLKADFGVLSRYYPDTPSGVDLVFKLQKLDFMG